jgi:hypothetical protein
MDDWPDYLPGPRDDLLALGVVSLNYGYMENILRILFAMVGDFSEPQVRAMFDRMNNDARQAILDQLLGQQPFSADLKALVRHFLKGYGICATNRHAIMHSHHGGIHSGARGTQGIVLCKYSRSGGEQHFFAHAAKLRAVADAIDQQSAFGREVILNVQSFQICHKQNRVADFERHPLPDKPPLPEPLDWQSQTGTQNTPSPPPPSQV